MSTDGQNHADIRGEGFMILINGTPLNVTIFPDNTSQVWKIKTLEIPDTNFLHITWEYSHEGEFMQLAQLKQLIDEGIGIPSFKTALRIKYLPYGRQDKEVSNSATFGLRTFANLLNSLNFDEVIIHDPHSELALLWINNSRAVYPQKLVEQIAQDMAGDTETLFCYPDKGALTKYTKVYELSFRRYVYGEKVRDQSTGNITSYKLVGDVAGKNVLIVDDICDGGATFKLLAKDLLAAGAKEVNLFVTHGIFSRGLQTLFDSGIKRIFTQDGEASEVQQQIAYRRL